MRFLITGLNGFAGRHLAALLLARGDEVHGTIRQAEGRARLRDLAARFPALRDDTVSVVDIGDGQALAQVVAAVKTDGLIHLAGITFVPDSQVDPTVTFRTNVLGIMNVFTAVQRHQPSCRVLAVGSADAYGWLEPEDVPVHEHCPFRPLNPYGASKAAADLVAYQWARGFGLDVVRVRPFNHTGSGQRPGFVCPDFARQIVAIERRSQAPTVQVGSLDVVRDFSDVRDVVAAYVAAWERGQSGEAYNICSGSGRSVRAMLETLCEIAGVEMRTSVVTERVRRVTVPTVIGSAEKLRAATGWTPCYQWRETLEAVLADWRQRA